MSKSRKPLSGLMILLVNLVAIVLVAVVGLLGWEEYQIMEANSAPTAVPTIEVETTSLGDPVQVGLPALTFDSSQADPSLKRVARMDTEIPERPTVDVTT